MIEKFYISTNIFLKYTNTLNADSGYIYLLFQFNLRFIEWLRRKSVSILSTWGICQDREALHLYIAVIIHKPINKSQSKLLIRAKVFIFLFKVQSDDYTKSAFEQEIRIMMKLKSENIIGFLDVNQTKSNIYIILEMANQGTLLDILK